ncbi:MAG: BlaI/MecI/CopY family transcriptional regulator, partial [Bacteroidaceae bacterium]|nr:BlaI/MecI/CopY family transcriptional regulator [Bacteroidaceae bacterium]
TKKGYVKSKKIGAMLYYVPAVSKEEYCKMVMDKAQVDYFDNDPTEFIAFILRNNTLTEEQKQAVKNLF